MTAGRTNTAHAQVARDDCMGFFVVFPLIVEVSAIQTGKYDALKNDAFFEAALALLQQLPGVAGFPLKICHQIVKQVSFFVF